MGKFVKGEVVVLPFPYSDLSLSKKRPALVIADLTGDDVILCQITSQFRWDEYSIPLVIEDFSSGKLPKPSCIRINRIFTADSRIILHRAGKLTNDKMKQVIEKLINMFK